MNDNKQLRNLFHAVSEFDAVAAVEKHVGADHHSDFYPDEERLMLSLAIQQNQTKERILSQLGDVTSSSELDQYLETIQRVGFEKAYAEVIEHKDRQEELYVFGLRSLGIILTFDSYSYENEEGIVHRSVNSSNWFACWNPKERPVSNRCNHLLSSGSWESIKYPDWRRTWESGTPDDLIWCGKWDAREAVWTKIVGLMEHGEFFPTWPKRLRYSENAFVSNYDYYSPGYEAAQASKDFRLQIKYIDDLSRARFEKMPDWIKAIVNGNIE